MLVLRILFCAVLVTLNEMFSVTSNIEEHRVYKAQTGRGFFQILRKKLSLHDPGTQLSPM